MIVLNAVACRSCGAIVVSFETGKHHRCSCSDSNFYISGGKNYLRRVGDQFIELAIESDERVVNRIEAQLEVARCEFSTNIEEKISAILTLSGWLGEVAPDEIRSLAISLETQLVVIMVGRSGCSYIPSRNNGFGVVYDRLR